MLDLTFLQELRATGASAVATALSGPHLGEKWLFSQPAEGIWRSCAPQLAETANTGLRSIGGTDYLVERFSARPTLTVFGGGHISVPICQLGAMLGFRVQVIDDRPDFARPDRFPEADRVICTPFSQAQQYLPQDANGYYVIVTRGHAGDQQCAELVLSRPFVYCGMIGSKKKVARSLEQLAKAGFSQAVLRRLHSPIGLPIGAQTPEEIAVSIAAELIQEKYRCGVDFLPEKLLSALEAPRPGDVLLTVARKEGSAPRGVGSKMLVRQDGSQVGTIGGGTGEFRACQDARACTAPMIRTYSMEPGGDLGMVCGGKVTVLFEPL